jgi:hypothetical protein
MIDISPYNDLPELTGVLDSYITESLYSDNFQIVKFPKRNFWMMSDKIEDFFDEKNNFYSGDNLTSITGYAMELLIADFSSILIAGLGIGIIPYMVKNHSSCSIIDVVEINQEMIDFVKPIGHLEGVNIINDSIFTYEPTSMYDIILLDIWACSCYENITDEISTLISKYSPSLNPNGFIYVPIHKNLGEVRFF